MRTIRLKSGQSLPSLGMGTWRMGENSKDFDDEVLALRHGLGLGFSLIDTAEMYGEGGAEEVVSERIEAAAEQARVFDDEDLAPDPLATEGETDEPQELG